MQDMDPHEDKNPRYYQNNNKHQSFRAKGVVQKITTVEGEDCQKHKYYVATVSIGEFNYDVPICKNVEEGDVLELIINVIKVGQNKFDLNINQRDIGNR